MARPIRRLFAAFLLGATVCAAPAPAASPAPAGPLEKVSRTADKAEGEETVAVNATDPNNIIVGSNQWQPLTKSNTGKRGDRAERVHVLRRLVFPRRRSHLDKRLG